LLGLALGLLLGCGLGEEVGGFLVVLGARVDGEVISLVAWRIARLVCWSHSSPLVVHYRVAIVGREHLVSHILAGHVGVGVAVVWLLLQFLMSMYLLRNNVVLVRLEVWHFLLIGISGGCLVDRRAQLNQTVLLSHRLTRIELLGLGYLPAGLALRLLLLLDYLRLLHVPILLLHHVEALLVV